jgi:hypothetical protein
MSSIKLIGLSLLSAATISAQAQSAFLQIRQNALSEEISPDYTYNITGEGTYSAVLSDKPNGLSHIFHTSGDAEGGLFAIANTSPDWSVNPGSIYYKASESSQWVNTGNSALQVHGGSNGGYISMSRTGTSSEELKQTADQLKYRANGSAAEIDITYNLAGERFMAIASNYDNLLYVVVMDEANNGTIYKKTVSGTVWTSTGITNVYNIAAVPNTDEIVYSKATSPDINFIFKSKNDGTSVVAWGNPIPDWDDDKIEYLVVSYDETNTMQLWVISESYVYQSTVAGTWSDLPGINAMRGIACTGGKILHLTMADVTAPTIPYRFFLVTQNGKVIDDERVRTGINSNMVTIPVAPGTYTITQTPVSGWHLTDIRIDEVDITGSSTDFVANSATVTVSANEVVVVEFENQLTQYTSLGTTCGTSFTEDFSSYGTGTWGDPLEGLTNYHKASDNFGYGHYAILASTYPMYYGDIIFDHTSGDDNGRMLVVDAAFEKGVFYRRRFTDLIAGGKYSFSAWATNYNPLEEDKPNISFEIYDLSGNLLASAATGSITTSEWRNFTTVFNSDGGDIELVLRNNKFGTTGNDLAIDDISFGLDIPTPTADITYNCDLGTATINVTSPHHIGTGDGYEYSLDGVNWQTSPTFAGVTPSNYVLTIRHEGSSIACESTLALNVTPCANVSGSIWNDANGDAVSDAAEPAVSGDNSDNNGGLSEVTGGSLYANVVDADNVVVGSVQVNADGSFTLGVEPNLAYSVIITTTPATIGSSLTVGSGPTGWEATGTNFGGTADITNTGYSIDLGLVGSDLTGVDFGMQRPPVADPKSFTVDASTFSAGAPTGFSEVPGYQYIPMNSPSLVGYPTGGSLSGSDAEDCNTASSCTSGTNTTFTIHSIEPNTILYYDFGTGGGVQIIDLSSGPVSIENFDVDKMIIFGQEGSGDLDNPLGFTYSMTDNAGSESPIVSYSIETGAPLAIQLISFEAIARNANVALNWTTAFEIQNKGFEIQRSSNSTDWSVIGFVNSLAENGNSNKEINYHFVDETPIDGSNYYRLKQIDFDGNFIFSLVRHINFSSKQSIRVYPNPTSENITIDGLQIGNHITITNILGQTLYSEKCNSKTITIDLSTIPSGILILAVEDGSGKITYQTKLVKK